MLSCLYKANASTILCRAIESGKRSAILQQGGKLPDDYIDSMISALNLAVNEAMVLGYCLVHSQYPSLSQMGLRVVVSRVPMVTDLNEVPEDVLQGLRLLCNSSRELAPPEVSGAFLNALYSVKRRPGVASVTSSGSLPGGIDMDSFQTLNASTPQRMSIAQVLSDYGCQCSQSVVSFRAALEEIKSKIALDEEQLGKIITTVTQPPSVDNMQIFNLLQGDESKLKSMTLWNLDVVSEVLAADTKSLDWTIVVRSLDQPNLKIRSEQDFLIIVKLVIRISGKPFPAAGLMGSWENRTAQLAFIVLGANLPRNVIDYAPICTPDCKLEGEVPFPSNLSWMSVHLYKTLIDLATRGLAREVLEALVAAAGMYPEYVTVGLAQVQDPASGVRAEILRKTLPLFTALPGSRASSIAVMKRLLEVNQDLLVILCRLSLKRAANMQQILDCDARLKSIGTLGRRVEEEGVLEELIGYWCVLSDRGEVNLEEKLNQQLARNPQQARALITFAKTHAETLRSRSVDGGLLSYESCAAILRVAQQHPSVVPLEEIRSLAAYLNQHMHAQHTAANTIDVATVETNRAHIGSDALEIEEEANAYFQKIYTSDITIPEVIQLLKRFKSSSDNREQEVFRCMIHNLFDEYRFFHKYPDKELQVTGRLFGALIQHQLVSSITLGIALRYVLEALRKDPEQVGSNEKMFRFGKIALDQFRARLSEWPQYCSHLIQIPHLSTHCPDVYVEAQRAIVSPTPQSAGVPIQGPSPTLVPPSAQTNSMPLSHSLSNSSLSSASGGGTSIPMNYHPNILQQVQPSSTSQQRPQGPPSFDHMAFSKPQDPLPAQKIQSTSATPNMSPRPAELAQQMSALSLQPTTEQQDTSDRKISEIERMTMVNSEVPNAVMPPENIRDQIHFIVNNIAKQNAEEKSLELKNILLADYYNWFANYLVVKRISTQPNLHSLYAQVLDIIESSPLLKTVMLSVYHNVTKLLQSPKIISSSTERSLLRNLGSWLGQMTIARNKPLLHRRINLKELVLWGYETGRLIAVCSFVAKILEGAKDSKIFRPPNPWLMALLGVMRELYELEDLKINIKFEVQVLCKNINIKIEDIPRGNVLSTRRTPIKNQNNQDFTFKGPIVPTGGSPKELSSLSQLSRAEDNVSTVNLIQTTTSAPSQIPPAVVSAPAERFEQAAIMNNLSAYVVVNPSLQYFASNPAHRKLVTVAVDRAIREVIQPVIERSVTMACVTTKQLVLKDLALDSTEQSIHSAAQLMVTNLASNMSLVTGREPLRLSIGHHLRSLLGQVSSDQSQIDLVAASCASDNVDLGCLLIEKAATEKATRDVRDIIDSELEIRRKQRENGQPVSESKGRFPRELPESLRPRVVLTQTPQTGVYEAFGKPRINLPQLPPIQINSSAAPPQALPATTAGALNMAQALEEFEIYLVRVDSVLKSIARQAQGRDVTLLMLGSDHELLTTLREMILVVHKTQPGIRVEAALTYAESSFRRFVENIHLADILRMEVVVGILEALRDACGGSKRFSPDLISWLSIYASVNASFDDNGRRVHRTLLILLLKSKFVKSQELDIYLASFMDGGRSMIWVEMALDFIRQCLTEGLAVIFEFPKTFDTVGKMRQSDSNVKKRLQKWLNDLKMMMAAREEQKVNVQPTPLTPTRETSVREHVLMLIDRWLRIWTTANDALFGSYLQMMHQYGVLKTEEAADRFFRIATEICIDACLKSSQGAEPPSPLNFTVVDALAKLFLLLVRLADKEASDMSVRVSLLSRILNAVARTLLEDHENKKNSSGAFDQRPYLRLFSFLSQDLGVPDPKMEPSPATIPLLTCYSQVYLALQPSVVPGFAFAWLQLISHRSFMPHLLLVKGQKGWPIMHRLLIAMLLFLQPFLKHVQMTEAVRRLYKSTLRFMLVILHDFPEFLSDYHLSLCDVIPPTCVQLRNLVLSAFPRTMRLPDPFTPNLKVDLLPEISQTPRIMSDYAGILIARGLRQHVDNFLATRQPVELPLSLANILASSAGNYSAPLFTALIVYIGSQAIVQQQQSKIPLQSSAAMDIFRALLTILDSEGKYLTINTMVNQLRFPNSHTHYFSCVLLMLFQDSEGESLQEQITRVLFERLIVHRPHPVS